MIILRNYGRNEGRILATTYPELAKEWNYEKNGALTPRDVTVSSRTKVWWKCSEGHEWEAAVGNRTQNSTGCPYCSGRFAIPGVNDLATLRPDLAAEWDAEMNAQKKPSEFKAFSKKKVWWSCPKGHPSYSMTIANRSSGHGCPVCGVEAIKVALSKPVIQYSRDGEKLRTFKSVSEAAFANGRKPASVVWVCLGKEKTLGGCVFRYVDQPPREKPPVPEEERLRDVLNQVVSVGDEVMFIKHTPHKAPKTLRGTVTEITKQSVLIRAGSGEDSRIMASRDDPVFLQKVLVMRPRHERPEEGDPDASGYPVREGDPVVYMTPLMNIKCKGFEFGTVKKAGGCLWEVNGNRRTSDRMVVVNW